MIATTSTHLTSDQHDGADVFALAVKTSALTTDQRRLSRTAFPSLDGVPTARQSYSVAPLSL